MERNLWAPLMRCVRNKVCLFSPLTKTLWQQHEHSGTQQSFLSEAIKNLLHRYKAYSPTHKHFTALPLVLLFFCSTLKYPACCEKSRESLIHHLTFTTSFNITAKLFPQGGKYFAMLHSERQAWFLWRSWNITCVYQCYSTYRLGGVFMLFS
jgi:hypothetical protein